MPWSLKKRNSMPLTHILLTLLVILIWGINFIFVRIGLDEVSPLLLCALRFLFASIPAIFFIKPPSVSFRIVLGYGFFMFGLQFGLVFLAMNVGMTPGMASLIMQVQVFFSMFFAAVFFKDMPDTGQIFGALLAFCGIAIVGAHLDADVSLAGFLCILGAAASWGIGNLVTKKVDNNLLSVVVWGSFIVCLPMFLLAWLFEGKESFVYAYQHASWKGITALSYIVYASTWVGYGVWNWLLSRYPVSMIVPFTLLVPFVGIISSVLIFGESFQLWKLAACLLVIAGLCINLLGSRLLLARASSEVA
jgi:O-acetylserine/cysteine efflux transporter